MQHQHTQEQIEKIRFHEEEASHFLRWTLGILFVTACAVLFALKIAHDIIAIVVGLGGLSLTAHAYVQWITALNSRDKARGYGNTIMYPYYALMAMVSIALVYVFFIR